MRALCWHGKKDIRCATVPEANIFAAPRDLRAPAPLRALAAAT